LRCLAFAAFPRAVEERVSGLGVAALPALELGERLRRAARAFKASSAAIAHSAMSAPTYAETDVEKPNTLDEAA